MPLLGARDYRPQRLRQLQLSLEAQEMRTQRQSPWHKLQAARGQDRAFLGVPCKPAARLPRENEAANAQTPAWPLADRGEVSDLNKGKLK